MKTDRTAPVRRVTRWAVWASECLLLWILSLAATLPAEAKGKEERTSPFAGVIHEGERLSYELYFKWGILMPRAGQATLATDASADGGETTRCRLLFHTSGMMERIYRMRDTLDSYYARPSDRLLYSSKRSNEKDYYSVDELTFRYDADSIRAHSRRYTLTRTKIDTLLAAPARLYDMLSATLYLRSIDWEGLTPGRRFPFHVAIGRDVVHVSYRYTGQQIVETATYKFRTRHFYIDIYDEAFTQSTAAAEVWVGDDANHVPVKIRAKLKIGAAEVYFKTGEGMPYPLGCRVPVKRAAR